MATTITKVTVLDGKAMPDGSKCLPIDGRWHDLLIEGTELDVPGLKAAALLDGDECVHAVAEGDERDGGKCEPDGHVVFGVPDSNYVDATHFPVQAKVLSGAKPDKRAVVMIIDETCLACLDNALPICSP